jgi:hypothetical protein
VFSYFLGCFLSDPYRFQLFDMLTGLTQSSAPAITSFDCRFTRKGELETLSVFFWKMNENLFDISVLGFT